MADRPQSRIVFSTGTGRVCPGLWVAGGQLPVQHARRGSRPARIVAKLRMEKKGRGGKTVTVVDGLPDNAAFLKDLSQELKRLCGTGGAVADGAVELQGDLRDRVREYLAKKGWTVKG